LHLWIFVYLLLLFLQIWTRKYVYIWNLTCTWSDIIRPCQNINWNASGGQILNFQNTFDRACDEIRMEIQTENFFRSLISMRFFFGVGVTNLVEIRLPKYFCEVSPACRYRAENIFGSLISMRLVFFFHTLRYCAV